MATRLPQDLGRLRDECAARFADDPVSRYVTRTIIKGARTEPGRQFRLASGRMSDYHIECALTTTNPAAIPLIGAVVHARLPTAAVAVGRPTMARCWERID